MSTAPHHLPLAAHQVLRAHSRREYAKWCESHEVPQAIFPANSAHQLDVTICQRPIPNGLLEVACAGVAAVRFEGTAEKDAYQLLLPVKGSGRLQLGPESVDLEGLQTGALIGPDQRHSLSLSCGWADLSVHVERATLVAALQAWTGRTCNAAPTFEAGLPLHNEQGRTLLALTTVLFQEADADASDDHLGGLLQRWCIRLLRTLPGDHQFRMAAPDPRVSRHHVRTAEAFMEANLSRSLHMTEIAREVGVGLRALQKAFNKHRGKRPLAVLRELRLEKARSLLLQQLELPVRDAAKRSGFTHMGRFSLGYRRAYGESPSTTRRRAHPTPFFLTPACRPEHIAS